MQGSSLHLSRYCGVDSAPGEESGGAVCPAFVLSGPYCLPCRECLSWRALSCRRELGLAGWVCSEGEHERRASRSGISHSPVTLPQLSLPAVKGHRVGGPVEGQVLLWVLVSLLPLVEGARMGAGGGVAGVGAESGHTVGLLGGQEGRQLPVTLPEVVEDEEQEDESDPYSTWHALYDPYVVDEVDDHPSSRWVGRSPRSSDPSEPQPKGSPKKKKKRKKKEKEGERERGGGGKGKNGRQPKQSSRDCRVEKREMRVRDLGLGFDSDEIVLFKFCVGSCQSSRTNYDLALKALLENGSLPRRTARKVSSHPCCRPDRYEPVSFMDAQTTWRTIQSLSAASCMCMG
ncbi:glial cell line-derived neurotrophic factor-like [Myripristis murdjan]|uniref:glial cell line-derived neurotrophic factor-like n=1 Tax=Myripristis murdjan TaxID=586833 RepID=UPI001175FBA0|nr:glial cell line-derived neurotrophic factor-like [Myripristis murdjan]